MALPPKRQSLIADFLLIFLWVCACAVYYSVYAAHPQFRLWLWFWIAPALFSAGIASAIGFSVHRLATAPHPFLS